MSNAVTQLIQAHRSIRKYKEKPITDAVLNDILASAQWAPTSNNFQSYSVIVIKDAVTKKKVAELCKGQSAVETCSVFLVFCVDYYRLYLACEKNGVEFDAEQLDHLIVGTVDATLALGNAHVAAKSHGLDGVMIGAVRKNSLQISELLKLPKYVFPLVGLALGHADEYPQQKPRFPYSGIVHNEFYHIDNTVSALEEYDTITENYYTERTNGEKTDGWSKKIADYFAKQKRPDIKDFILEKGFNVK